MSDSLIYMIVNDINLSATVNDVNKNFQWKSAEEKHFEELRKSHKKRLYLKLEALCIMYT